MEYNTIVKNNQQIAEVTTEELKIKSVNDALDLMGFLNYQGFTQIILKEKHFGAEFFDLKTKIAGDILQKYVNYGVKLAIVGDFSSVESNSLNAFIIECNRGKHIFFADSTNQAVDMLAA